MTFLETKAANGRRMIFASLQIVKPSAIVPKDLSPRNVADIFNLQKFIQRMGKVRVDVRVVRRDDKIIVADSLDNIADEIFIRVQRYKALPEEIVARLF